MATDTNGFPVKPGHTGNAGPNIGPMVWVLERMDGKVYGAWPTRHDAIGAAARMKSCKYEWFTPKRIRAGSYRFDDYVTVN